MAIKAIYPPIGGITKSQPVLSAFMAPESGHPSAKMVLSSLPTIANVLGDDDNCYT
jgi:hypothetical protein